MQHYFAFSTLGWNMGSDRSAANSQAKSMIVGS
jgi:hypothetical protein